MSFSSFSSRVAPYSVALSAQLLPSTVARLTGGMSAPLFAVAECPRTLTHTHWKTHQGVTSRVEPIYIATKISSGWRVAAEMLNAAQLFMFLPSLVLCVPFRVFFKGGDSLSLCFNSLAVLFLCDLDTIAFKIAMSEQAKQRVDQV